MLNTADIEEIALLQRRLGVESVEVTHGASRMRVVVRTKSGGVPEVLREPSQTDSDADGSKTVVRSPALGFLHLRHPSHSDPQAQPGRRFSRGEPVVYLQLREVLTSVDAPCTGTLTRLLVEDGQQIDYGKALFEFEEMVGQ